MTRDLTTSAGEQMVVATVPASAEDTKWRGRPSDMPQPMSIVLNVSYETSWAEFIRTARTCGISGIVKEGTVWVPAGFPTYTVGNKTTEERLDTLVADHAVNAVRGIAVVELLGGRLGGVGDHANKDDICGVTSDTTEGSGRRGAEGELGHVELLGACVLA
jgi:hypothetical protein